MQEIIKSERSIIPACDVDLELYERIVKETSDVEGIGAYKIGFELGLSYGLPQVVELTRKYNNKPIIYDHQKAGTDIPDTGKNFARTMKNAGVDAVILFPQSGPETEKAWIEAAFEQGLGVIVGGLMTHKKYLRSEGGYLADDMIMEMYLKAVNLGVNDFVVPGNKPEKIEQIRTELLKNGFGDATFYAPGFVAQGGSISEAAKAAGSRWHAIVGRGLYQAEDIRKAALEYTSQL